MGLSIAWAVAEHPVSQPGIKRDYLYPHYPELKQVSLDFFAQYFNYQVTVKEIALNYLA
jgi:hypothetical protein